MTTEYTPDTIKSHNTPADCWLIIHKKVYDVSSYLSSHPGGAEIILSCAGKDATREFDDIGHSKSAIRTLAKYEIGVCPVSEVSAPNEQQPSLWDNIVSWVQSRFFPNPNQTQIATLLSRSQITHDTVSLIFALPHGNSLGLKCGQHIVIHVGDAKRKYTPISDVPGSFEIVVKIYKTGVVSPHIGNLKFGDTMTFSGATGQNIYLGDGRFSVAGGGCPPCSRQGGFGREPSVPSREIQSDNLLMICAGSGITPIYAVLRHITKRNEYGIRANLLFVNKTSDDIILREEIDQMCFNHPNITAQYTLTQKNSSWSGLTGRPTPNMIANVAKQDFTGIVLICGSSDFNSGISQMCCDVGFIKSNIIIF
jgi:nitrate reductase (NAD(P)H)